MNHHTCACTSLLAAGERQSTTLAAAVVVNVQANLKKQKKPDENLVSHTLPV